MGMSGMKGHLGGTIFLQDGAFGVWHCRCYLQKCDDLTHLALSLDKPYFQEYTWIYLNILKDFHFVF